MIKKEFPPNIEEIRKHFKLHPGIIFSYAPNIYNPDNGYIDRPLLEHEETHIKQQGTAPEVWWSRYFEDVDFRLSQEVEAYQTQYESMKEHYKKKFINIALDKIATDLSSAIYGSLVSKDEAINLITKNGVQNNDSN